MDPRRLLPYLLGLTAFVVIATAALVLVSLRSTTPEAAPPGAVEASESGPRKVLAAWDQQRSEAWERGDTAALRDLYVAGSRTGRADARMLAAYVDRGLHVEGLATQVLALDVLAEDADELTVRVTDRVVRGVVVGSDTTARLPRDRASTRTLTLRLVDGTWLVDAVRDHARAAESTSRTSTSWKS